MNVYEKKTVEDALKGNPYPGRGIIIGVNDEGNTVAAYFIMGRSPNSRNRVFVEKEDGIYTEPFDASKVEDPSLIIYRAAAEKDGKFIVTNGDQTDTIYDGLAAGKTFKEALEERCFEPDAPNYTPRISGIIYDDDYEISILKSIDAEGTDCARYTYSYPKTAGLGHLIHTYVTDGSPLPTFNGEPVRLELKGDVESLTDEIWDSLDEDNKISLVVRVADKDGNAETKIVNKYIKE